MSSSKDTHLYQPRSHNLSNGKPINTSTSLAFSSQLSSLISAPSTTKSKPTSSRLKPTKDDIFTRPNRNTAKRAKRDAEDSPHFEQKHTTDGEGLDSKIWERSKRKMEEKARLYAAMRRGDVEDAEGKFGVDFDRKWAEEGEKEDEEVEDEDEDEEGEGQEEVEYTDEFGRVRTGTRAQAERVQRAVQARPLAPSHIIHGDTIQHSAFDPDAPIAAQMAELARKRDKSLTPPPDEHFDASKEVRSKGTGFYQFSEDVEERKRQMAGLESERKETERKRAERQEKLEERKRLVEERRKEVQGRRAKRKADEFLEELGAEMGQKGVEEEERVEGETAAEGDDAG
ncbi:uncharacterized protein LTR77_005661 [Saxophila tyrrhenica]|uniref:Uncharacterized protein n=1 Tax=Saxophila tyrrhenica TaxID=1690608 RepID=A0AAV9P9Y3_9PEZI|nr:hypothetical protein LTR77_005661 [Saxophila tyrrhenica]